MITLEDNFNERIKDKTYIALGSFDGLHLGHIALIEKTLELSKKNNMKSMVCTFKNHPLSVINKDKMPKLLMDNEAKLNVLEDLGIDIVNLVKFDTEFMKISPENFILNMINYYNCIGIIVGFNYRFGYRNSGDVDFLKTYSSKLGFELHVIDSVTYNNEVVSSSRIRSLIAEGNLSEANNMLVLPYMLSGKIIEGKQIGRKIGFPTANLQYNDDFIIPAKGVYYTIVEYDSKLYKGITSVGYNPTVHPAGDRLTIETYLLDFDKDIYGESIKLYFINRMRNEVKFSSMDELVIQLNKDRNYAKEQLLEKFSFILKK